ncbi:hypothetical protein [Cryptosporangium sp. NPDC051539]|uniref:hypothetical protein n=1 Tax=Cryptosporangium sp. NPDC051539 TaxID=3363962 RepID=UPI0037872A54
MTDQLHPGENFAVGGELLSGDQESRLVLQGDGNLVLYRASGAARWATATSTGTTAVMQTDGNFVVYGAAGQAVWATGTDGHPGAFLVLQDDGNLVVYRPGGTALWASNTVITRRSVSGFLPRSSGFRFSNSSFPSVPDLTLRLYDPNYPGDDSVTMTLSLADPQHTAPVTNSVVPTVWCFFSPIYLFAFPPAGRFRPPEPGGSPRSPGPGTAGACRSRSPASRRRSARGAGA